MQLSLHADYACRVLMYVGAKGMGGGERASIAEIAAAFDISENHLTKVVHRLGQLGYLTNTRGRGGGISLAKEPHRIAVGDVIRAMEPSLDVVECFDNATNTCPINGFCGLKGALTKARSAFLEVLDGVTLADIMVSRRLLLRNHA